MFVQSYPPGQYPPGTPIPPGMQQRLPIPQGVALAHPPGVAYAQTPQGTVTLVQQQTVSTTAVNSQHTQNHGLL